MLASLSKSRLFAATLLSGVAVAALAAPTVVDFETAPPLTVVGTGQPDPSYTEGGVTFTPSGGDAMVDLSFCAPLAESCISNNASVYLTALNGAEVTISAGRWFTLGSLDASFFPAPTPPGFYSGLNFGLQVAGSLWGGGSTSATLSLLEDSQILGDFVFSSYAGLGSAQLQSVTFSACWFESASSCVRSGTAFDNAGLLFNDMAFAIDNLSISIPEPSAAWLTALALAGLAGSRRRAARQ